MPLSARRQLVRGPYPPLWQRGHLHTNTNKFPTKPRTMLGISWLHYKVVRQSRWLCVTFIKHFQKHFSLSLPWTRSHLSTGFSSKPCFPKRHFGCVHIRTSVRWCDEVVVFMGLVHYQVLLAIGHIGGVLLILP